MEQAKSLHAVYISFGACRPGIVHLAPARYMSVETLGDLERSRLVFFTTTRLSPDLWRWWWWPRSSMARVVVTFSRPSRITLVSDHSSFCSSGGTQRLMST